MSEERMHPFDIREQFTLLDRLHEYQKASNDLKNFAEGEFKYFRERIDQGLSPTMQKVKSQNEDLEKMIIRLEGKFDLAIKDLANQYAVAFKEIENLNGFVGSIKDIVRNVTVAGIIGIAGTFMGMWVYVQQIKIRIDSLPSSFEVRHHATKKQKLNENNPFGVRE